MKSKFLDGSYVSKRYCGGADGEKIVSVAFPIDIFDYKIYTLDDKEYIAISRKE